MTKKVQVIVVVLLLLTAAVVAVVVAAAVILVMTEVEAVTLRKEGHQRRRQRLILRKTKRVVLSLQKYTMTIVIVMLAMSRFRAFLPYLRRKTRVTVIHHRRRLIQIQLHRLALRRAKKKI